MRKTYILDGSKINSLQEVHTVLQEALQLPSYYGCNLDALYDCLTEMNAEIVILNLECIKICLGEYFNKFWNVFETAQKENPLLYIKVFLK